VAVADEGDELVRVWKLREQGPGLRHLATVVLPCQLAPPEQLGEPIKALLKPAALRPNEIGIR